MIIRGLDTNGDWTFGRGRANYQSATGAVALHLQTRLYMVQGDCFFDADGWIDWFNLLGSRERAGLVYAVRSIILNTDGVARLNSVDVSLDPNRRATLAYDVTSIYNTPIYGQVFQVPAAPYTGISKFVRDVEFAGEAQRDVDVSLYIGDAMKAVWMLYEVANGYTPVIGAVQPLSRTTVRINMAPAATGVFRLVGVA